MSAKKDNLVVKIESKLLSRVEELATLIETRLAHLNEDSYKKQLNYIHDQLHKIDDDINSASRRLCELMSWISDHEFIEDKSEDGTIM